MQHCAFLALKLTSAVRSKTGSGKTAAYVLPALQTILKGRTSSVFQPHTAALILVPTRELAGQVAKVAQSLAAYCSQDIRVENLTKKENDRVQAARLGGSPDIVIATPGRAVTTLNASSLSLSDLSCLIIDEADLILSYDYEDDLKDISKALPQGVQTILMSATLRADLSTLQSLFCRDPVILDLDDEDKDSGSVSQYVIRCAEDEKFLLLYAIFMLKLIKGKVIVFVGDIDRCYRLKLFLEQFGIKSCVLNSELPVNSRIHVVEEFNRNVYNIIIATDEHEVLGDEGSLQPGKPQQGEEEGQVAEAEETTISHTGPPAKATDSGSNGASDGRLRKKPRKERSDKDYGVARGIDFKNVSCVLNFDLPTTSKSYTHRIGRTARAGQSGMALSFVIPTELYRRHKPTSLPSTQHDEAVLVKIAKSQEKRGLALEDYKFDMKRLDGFRYRLNDALRAVTGVAVKEARVHELRQELMKSEKLKRHFEENPDELRHLRHDGESHAARVQAHMKHVPEYLMPAASQKGAASNLGFVGMRKREIDGNRIRKARLKNKAKGKPKKSGLGRNNPLQSFKAKR